MWTYSTNFSDPRPSRFGVKITTCQNSDEAILGTGKSFIGELIAKALFDHTKKKILVVCFTNHALDDILEGLLNIGIPESVMLRLGGKTTSATERLTLQNQPRIANRSQDQWTIINNLKERSEKLHQLLQDAFRRYNSPRISYKDMAEYLEFDDPEAFEALRVPYVKDSDGMTLVDKGGREINPSYLMDRWKRGFDAGIFKGKFLDPDLQKKWEIPKKTRETLWRTWEEGILQEDVKRFCELAQTYNKVQDELNTAQNTNMIPLLQTKRVLGCTTTAAAKFCGVIQAFNPNVLLVEEAGEILESHILTAMGPETSQIILIGDHKYVYRTCDTSNHGSLSTGNCVQRSITIS